MDTETLLLNAPLGVRVEHSSKLKLAMFLTAMKTTVDSAAPGSVKWQTKSHGEAKYVVLSSDEMGMPEQLRVCYAVTKSALIITLREDVLKRAMDRENAEHKLELSKIQQHADHLYINADSRFLMGLTSLDGTSFPERRREQSYRAIPILNQWIKINATADESPVEVQQRLFGEDVYCPGGKGYQWNEQDMTMESVVYGHPASPKQVDLDQSLLSPFGQIESAIKFEHDGLRVNLKFSQRQLSK